MNGKSAMSEEKLDDAVEGPLLTHDFKINNSGSLELVGAQDRNPVRIKDFDDIYKRPEEETTAFGVVKRCVKRKIDKLSVTRIVLANFPILATLKRYKIKQDLPSDIIAGLTAGVMMIPQGMAFAHLSTLPPIVGLYISLFSSVVYIFMGMGHQLSWGCIAILSIMMGSILDKYDQKIQDSMKTSSCNFDLTELVNSTSVWQSSSTPLPVSLSVEKRIEVAAAVTLICGLILAVLGKLGFAKLTTYMSDSLVTGFTVAASCHVATSQLKSTFGLNFLPRHNGMFQLIKVWIDFLSNIHKSNPATVIMTFTSILIIYLVKRFINEKYQKKIKIPIPIELIVLVIATVVNSQTKLNEKFSFSIVRDVPVGIPSPKIPDMSLAEDYIVDGMVIIIVAFAQNIALAKLFAIKHKYKVNADQEMFANGVICVVCSLFSGFIAGASVSRSLVQDGAGGKTQVASAFAAGVVLLVVMLLGPYFYYLPTCVLAAVILVNLYAMFLKLLTIPDLWRKSKPDCLMWVITFLAVVIIDPAMGLLVGIISSIMLVLIQSQINSVDVTAWVAVGNHNVWRTKENYFCTQDVHDVRVVRVNGPLYFANAEIVTNNIFKKSGKNPVRMRRKQAEMHKAANSVGSAGGKEIDIHQPDDTIKDIAETDLNDTCIMKDEDHATGNEIKQDVPVVIDLNKLPTVEIRNGDAKEEEEDKEKGQGCQFRPCGKSSEETFEDNGLSFSKLIVDLSGASFMDLMGVKALEYMIAEYQSVGISVYFSNIHERCFTILEKSGFLAKHGDKVFISTDAAIQSLVC